VIVLGVNLDIVFLSYDEKNANKNFSAIQERYPRAKRLHGVRGFGRANVLTSELVDGSFYWLIDGDNRILSDFDLDALSINIEEGEIRVWKARNAVNDLEYGFGGIKLCSYRAMKMLDTSKVDLFSSTEIILSFDESIASVTEFNADPFSAWKAGFRECAMLAGRSDFDYSDVEAAELLRVWKTRGRDKPFGKWVHLGAAQGEIFGTKFRQSPTLISSINDPQWLREKFLKNCSDVDVSSALSAL